MRDGSVIVLIRVVHHELPRQMQPTILKLKADCEDGFAP